jgi:hypothetical protein
MNRLSDLVRRYGGEIQSYPLHQPHDFTRLTRRARGRMFIVDHGAVGQHSDWPSPSNPCRAAGLLHFVGRLHASVRYDDEDVSNAGGDRLSGGNRALQRAYLARIDGQTSVRLAGRVTSSQDCRSVEFGSCGPFVPSERSFEAFLTNRRCVSRTGGCLVMLVGVGETESYQPVGEAAVTLPVALDHRKHSDPWLSFVRRPPIDVTLGSVRLSRTLLGKERTVLGVLLSRTQGFHRRTIRSALAGILV